MTENFLGGVIEGFYGRPWTHQQRLALMPKLAAWGLNTYFYAPKDDLNHRANWRRPYADSELTRMGELVEVAHSNQISFIYGLSPGLDIRFSDATELGTLQRRLEQMMQIGVQHFALLFDDLPGEISASDRQAFASVAEAQASVTNSIYRWLGERNSGARLLFCPTPYCDRMDRADLGGSDYLGTIGQQLDVEVDCFWTGPEIISRDIPVESIKNLSDRIGRAPVIWDNLHANDYDQRRLFCGPYNRSPELRESVRGILINPNNEYWINEVPLRTLGLYLGSQSYDSREAYIESIGRWTQQFETFNSQISADDLLLLADCHYLPHFHGEMAQQLAAVVNVLLSDPCNQWGDSLDAFERIHNRVDQLFEQLTELKNRELFYDWSRRIWDLKEELDLISDVIRAKREDKLPVEGFVSESHLPKTCRGGFVADLQRLVVMNDDGRFEIR